MKEYRQGEPATLFKTLSDPTRLRLLNLLAGEETCL
jgi:DNA-binding transcriptional ArsR family regulator